MLLALSHLVNDRRDMNRQRQAVECKICPGVVHSYPPKPITRSVEPKTVSLMRRKSTFQVACHAHRRSPRIRSIANLPIYLPFIQAARFFQKSCDVLGCGTHSGHAVARVQTTQYPSLQISSCAMISSSTPECSKTLNWPSSASAQRVHRPLEASIVLALIAMRSIAIHC